MHVFIYICICAFKYSKICPWMSLVVGIRSVCMWRLLFLYLLILFLIFHFQFLSNPDLVTNKNLYRGARCQFRPLLVQETFPQVCAVELPCCHPPCWVCDQRLPADHTLSVIAMHRLWGKKVPGWTLWLQPVPGVSLPEQ